MGLSISDIWRQSKGIGRLGYNFRMIAYVTAAVIVVTYHLQYNLPLGFIEYLTLSFVFLIPAVMLFLFVKHGKDTRYIIWGLTVDFFCVGWVAGVIDLCIIPSAAFALGAVTNHVAAKGFDKIYRIILLPVGTFITWSLGGFETHFESTMLINYMTIGYAVIHYIANSYVLAVSINRVKNQNHEIRKQRIEIEEKSEELQVLNESLKDMNATLEQKVATRTRELEVKNKKLQEYTFVNSHKLRAPVVRILGLVNLLDYKNIYDSEMIVTQLKNSATELDDMTKDIGAKLEEGSAESSVKSQ